eukprot:1157840-Pelagomonas_calceolata.AAC.9
MLHPAAALSTCAKGAFEGKYFLETPDSATQSRLAAARKAGREQGGMRLHKGPYAHENKSFSAQKMS